MNNYFKLEDIKAGYLLEVELNGKELFNMTVQYNKADMLGLYGESENRTHYFPLGELDTHLEYRLFNYFKITKIYGRTNNRFLLANDIEDRELLWEHQGTKEMTIEDVQKELGYKIKIVEEKQ